MAYVESERILSRRLDTVGDGTGTKNATGDYSVTPQEFFIQAPVQHRYTIERMLVSMEDTGGFQAQEYGNLGAALTNGITVSVDDGQGTVTADLTDGSPITSNAEWGIFCYDVDLKTWGSGNELLVARWTFSRSGAPIFLKSGHRLVVSLNDNFTGLIEHEFVVQGLIV